MLGVGAVALMRVLLFFLANNYIDLGELSKGEGVINTKAVQEYMKCEKSGSYFGFSNATCGAPKYKCNDFKNQQEAQKVFINVSLPKRKRYMCLIEIGIV